MNKRVKGNTVWKEETLVSELLERDTSISPDYLKLKLEDFQFVFVYGTLKSGGRFSHVLEDSHFLGDALTQSSTYTVFESDWEFPVLFGAKDGKMSPETYKVYGEAYAVSPRTMLDLDRIENNGVMYKREERFISLLDQELPLRNSTGKRPYVKAWVYSGIPAYWDQKILKKIPLTKITGDKQEYVYEYKLPKNEITSYADRHAY